MGTGIGSLIPAITSITGYAIGKGMVVGEFHRFGECIHANHAEHRTENLFLINLHVWRHVIKQRGTKKIARYAIGYDQARHEAKDGANWLLYRGSGLLLIRYTIDYYHVFLLPRV